MQSDSRRPKGIWIRDRYGYRTTCNWYNKQFCTYMVSRLKLINMAPPLSLCVCGVCSVVVRTVERPPARWRNELSERADSGWMQQETNFWWKKLYSVSLLVERVYLYQCIKNILFEISVKDSSCFINSLWKWTR